MTAEELYKLKKQRPFQPFRILMEDGQEYDVRSHEMMMVLRDTVVVGVGIPPDDPDPVPDHCEWVHIPHIRRIEPLPREMALPVARHQ